MLGDFLAGITHAGLSTAVGYPFEVVKIKMQSGYFDSSLSCINHIYNSMESKDFIKVVLCHLFLILLKDQFNMYCQNI